MSDKNDKAVLKTALSKGLLKANIVLAPDVQEKLITYIEQLNKWNAVHNLTAIRDPLEMVQKHLLDSLVVLPYLDDFCQQNNLKTLSVLDVGTGPGLPGIPLALARPEHSFCLLDSHHKKMTFVERMVSLLQMPNVLPVCERVEKYHPEKPFDWVISRAFSRLFDFIRLSETMVIEKGQWVAMKGDIDAEELSTLPPGYAVQNVASLTVPGLFQKRSLVFVVRI